MTKNEAEKVKALTDAIVENLNTIHAFGYDLTDLGDMAKASAEAIACLQELNQSEWTVDDIDEIGNKAGAALTTLQELDQSDWSVGDIDEIGKKAAETLVTLQKLEEAR
jgi:hypothetical protein